MPVFESSVQLPVPVSEAFAWHQRPGAFLRMVPPWENVQLQQSDQSLTDGSKVVLRVPLLGSIKKTWVAEHFNFMQDQQFCDRQLTGPFGRFEHRHLFETVSANACRLTDRIEFQAPMGVLGKLAHPMITRRLQSTFAYRHRVLLSDLKRHHEFIGQPRKTIAVTGSTGLIGTVLCAFLNTGGHHVIRLVRREPRQPFYDGSTTARWNPERNEIDASSLEGVDAVIHLAGEGIANKRWNAARKEQIINSRVQSTKLLSTTLAGLNKPPAVFFSASAIGYYAPSGDQPLTESEPPGTGFLSEVCVAWEKATQAAEQAGIRTVHGRVGVVLARQGGALASQLPLFQWCVAGRLGSGKQYVPWIEIGDLVGAIYLCIMQQDMRGPVNLTAPEPVTNVEFTRTLGRVLRRPTIFPAPAFALRLALGEMADALLLASLQVIPERLQQTGFAFDYPTLEPALRHVLGVDK
ncbi:MAG: TIGR01777 family oxidoreductase [Planctomycetia bacterium]|nr:TIGR01777 family oxidoreductase [Planctomycetia bacterium]